MNMDLFSRSFNQSVKAAWLIYSEGLTFKEMKVIIVA